MTREEQCSRREEVVSAYSRIGKVNELTPYGNGHINDTFLIATNDKRYILQRINTTVFPCPEKVMANIKGVTEHIRGKVAEKGGDAERATLSVVNTDDGQSFFVDSIGSYWRVYDYVENTVAVDKLESSDGFSICGKAFGSFQGMLADYPSDTLYEVIKDFHNTPVRLEALVRAAEDDKLKRADGVKSELEFAYRRREFCNTLENARIAGELPVRVTHNDTKLNNILFDANDGHAVCVIDLDTVMPGFSVNDFGDSIRFGASSAPEDEPDLSRVYLDLGLFEAYARGFIDGCDGRLTDREISLMPVGAMMMTLECGMRFLTDYLNGDVYFKIHRAGHNLDRARNQFALLSDMESKLDKMNDIINKLR